MSVLVKLRENKNFSNNEKIVAKYILDNFKKIKEIDINIISKETYVSISSITRMSKRLGYKGFKELKILLIEELIVLNNKNLEYGKKEISKFKTTKDIISNINLLSIKSLIETKLLQNEKTLEEISKLIDEKDIIDLYGVGASYIVCLDAEYKFLRVGKQTNTFNSFDKQYIQAKNSNKNHLAIIISYSGETLEMIKISEILKEKNIKTVSITKITKNSIAKLCDYNLFVTSKEGKERIAAIYSRISILSLIDTLYFIYYNSNYKKASINISETKIKKRGE